MYKKKLFLFSSKLFRQFYAPVPVVLTISGAKRMSKGLWEFFKALGLEFNLNIYNKSFFLFTFNFICALRIV